MINLTLSINETFPTPVSSSVFRLLPLADNEFWHELRDPAKKAEALI
jgi:hypothetical protein